MTTQLNVLFDVTHLYYLPQYLPAARALQLRGARCRFVFYRQHAQQPVLEQLVATEQLDVSWADDASAALAIYREQAPHWVVFGNGFAGLGQLPAQTRSALLYHGIGVKDCYYDADLAAMTIRFVEGEHRAQEIHRRFPAARVEVVGFAKLDPLLGPESARPRFNLAAHGLDAAKRTVLYAPTFFPSSIELLPDNWPEQFSEFNLVVKPHFFTMQHARYAAQRRKIERWRKYPNVYVARDEDYSLLPFMASADVLVSEASSALFEFAALDRPVVWCDFYKLRWSYRGPLRYRFERRMDHTMLRYADVGAHAGDGASLLPTVRQQLDDPTQYHDQRRRYTEELIGATDGLAAQRIADYLFANRTG